MIQTTSRTARRAMTTITTAAAATTTTTTTPKRTRQMEIQKVCDSCSGHLIILIYLFCLERKKVQRSTSNPERRSANFTSKGLPLVSGKQRHELTLLRM